jgi:hypothetical protein
MAASYKNIRRHGRLLQKHSPAWLPPTKTFAGMAASYKNIRRHGWLLQLKKAIAAKAAPTVAQARGFRFVNASMI